MITDYLEPWQAVTHFASKLEAELRLELSQGHPLFGQQFTAIAQRVDSDDVLYRLESSSGRSQASFGEGPPVVVVHLSWSGAPEPSADWPKIRAFSSWEEWKHRCMIPAHEAFCKGYNSEAGASDSRAASSVG